MVRHIILLLLFCSAFIGKTNAQHTGNQYLDIDDIVRSEKSGASLKTFVESDLTSNYDVNYYRLNLNVRPDTLYIEGKVTIYFTPYENLSSIIFDITNKLVVDSINHLSGGGIFTHTQNRVLFEHNFSENILDSITIFYHGVPNSDNGAIVSSSHSGTPIMWTLSEPYGAKDWWPCKQSLTDKADSLDTYITVPTGNKVAGNGTLINELNNPDTTTTIHWKCRYPIVPYLIAFAVTPYAEISFQSQLTTGDLLVQNYVYKEDSTAAYSQLWTTDTLLRFYDSLVGPYPFMDEKYGHAQFGRGGGMEHQTMSFMYHFGFSLNAHELAHQWFGDKITCGSWQDIWLNEGFATYFAGLPLETLYDGYLWNDWKVSVLDVVVSEPGGSVLVYDTTNVGRIFDPRLTYRKGAYVLHMLRKQIGDVAFFEAIRTYLTDPNLAYSTALTDDLFAHFETQTGYDLTSFKNEWIYQEGYPSFGIDWEQKNDEIQMSLTQTTSHSSVSFFHLSVPILLESVSGDSLWLKLQADQNQENFVIPVNFEVSKISIDPELDLISKGNYTINKSTLTELKIYPNPVINQLTISPGGDLTRIVEYEIYSIDGKLVLFENQLNHSFPWAIDVSKLVQGNYTIILKSPNESTSLKFVVSH